MYTRDFINELSVNVEFIIDDTLTSVCNNECNDMFKLHNSKFSQYILLTRKHATLHCSGTQTHNATLLINPKMQCYFAQKLLKHAMLHAQKHKQSRLHCSGTQTCNVTLFRNPNIQCYIAQELKHSMLHC